MGEPLRARVLLILTGGLPSSSREETQPPFLVLPVMLTLLPEVSFSHSHG